MNKDKGDYQLNNRGFSLIELLISIAIIVIIMVPLMNNFIKSMQMNKKAERLQVQSNLAASIMEGLKSLNMEQTLSQFTGIGGIPFTIITDANGNPITEVMRLSYDALNDTYVQYDSMEEQATYYFAIHGIKAGGTAYDAFITMDSLDYRNVSSTMNDYPMPDIINLDENTNALLLSSGKALTDTIDQQVLLTFAEWGRGYANRLLEQSSAFLEYLNDYNKWKDDCEKNAMLGLPPPYDEPTRPRIEDFIVYRDYYDTDRVKELITKTMRVIVDQSSVEYGINYECNWPVTDLERVISYPVAVKDYPNRVENIYLFYEPSIFLHSFDNPEQFEIINAAPPNTVNFFIVYQNALGGIEPYIKIDRTPVVNNNINVYTNLSATHVTGSTNSGIVKTQEKDRIFRTTIDLCEYRAGGPENKYDKVLYKLESTREE